MEERRTEEDERTHLISRPPSFNQSFPYPWLVIFDGDNHRRQTFYSISHNRYYVRHIQELHNKFIVSSQQGWLLLEDRETDDAYLYNIYSMEKLQLPPLDIHHTIHCSVLSSTNKVDNTCRVLVVSGIPSEFRSCYLGDSEFVVGEVSYTESHSVDREISYSFVSVVNYEGKLYSVTFGNYDLLVADFDDPELHFSPIIKGYHSISQMLGNITNDANFYLVESCGELLYVYTNCLDHDDLDVKIFKANLDNKEWEEVESLGDRVLFLDYYKGLCCPASFGLRGNCVYYVKGAGDGYLYVYDLEDKTITTSLPCPIVSNKTSALYWAM